jgi:predicted RNA methylase
MEKRSEKELSEILCDFQQDYIFYTPNKNKVLKKLFKTASKQGKSIGIPDRIFFNDDILIIFECKASSLIKAEKDVIHYMLSVQQCEYKIFGVAFVDKNSYKILCYDKTSGLITEINDIISMTTFNLNIKYINYTTDSMSKDIRNIHSYIRDYTKISNEDKPFFIAIILISIKKKSFRVLIDNYNEKKHIYDILSDNLREYNIDIDVFSFLKTDENNKHFYNIIKMIQNIYEKSNNDIDLLNEFYSEFVRYNNSDGGSLGIVLTPPHIVSRMVKMLDIKTNDIVLDLCSGTGSFLLESLKYSPKKIIGCEYQTKLFNLLKCNIILRNATDCSDIIKGDCFQQNFKATKSLINPPYGMKDKKELEFVLKQLESVSEGCEVCAIIPIGNLTDSKQNNKLKKQISDTATVKSITVCNDQLFYPYAGVKTCILMLQKNSHGHNFEKDVVKFIDYNDDGFEIKRTQGRVKTRDENICEIDKLIKLCDDWYFQQTNFGNVNLKNIMKNKIISEYNEKINNITDNIIDISSESKRFLISDLFNILKKPLEPFKEQIVVNCVAAKNNNLGIKGVCESNKNTFTGNKIVLITGGDGGAGLAFYHKSPFNISSSVCVLDPKYDFMDENNGFIIAEILSSYKQKYSHGLQWSIDRISKDDVFLPVVNGKINFSNILKHIKE